MTRQRLLFVCWHNSARSQMAEGLLRDLAGDRFEVFSAGIEASTVRPEAVVVMREIGIDIGAQWSKTLDGYLDQPFEWLITVCDTARQQCPVVPGVERTLHWSVEDPAAVTGSRDERLAAFRLARDDLRGRVRAFMLSAGREEQLRLAADDRQANDVDRG